MAPPIYMRPKGACVTDESNLQVQHSPMLSSGYAREQKRKSQKRKDQPLLQEFQPELPSKLQEFDRTKILCKHVRRVIVAIYKEHLSIVLGYDFPDIMIADVDMLRASFGDRIRCYKD